MCVVGCQEPVRQFPIPVKVYIEPVVQHKKLDADIGPEDLDDADPFEEGDLGVLSDVGLPDAVLGVIISEYDLYADEQLGRIAREMGFAEELSAVLDRLDR